MPLVFIHAYNPDTTLQSQQNNNPNLMMFYPGTSGEITRNW